ncbi:flavoprotein [Arcanobacterium hippocoleae]
MGFFANQISAVGRSRPLQVVLGVTGGIAAYKSVTLVRLLRKAGIEVHVIPTQSALEMVGKTTWEAISGNQVYLGTAENAADVTHVRFGQQADLIVIAPITANTVAKLRAGIADNLLCSTVLAARCPILLAPAMHTEMWNNPATMENISVLKSRGFQFIGPESGQLTGTDSGLGRMSEPEDIFLRVKELLTPDESAADLTNHDSEPILAGKKFFSAAAEHTRKSIRFGILETVQLAQWR